MTHQGSRFVDRHQPPVRQVGRCRGCGQDREGETRFETAPHGSHPLGRPIHFCDECDARLLASERPLEAVLIDLLGGL